MRTKYRFGLKTALLAMTCFAVLLALWKQNTYAFVIVVWFLAFIGSTVLEIRD